MWGNTMVYKMGRLRWSACVISVVGLLCSGAVCAQDSKPQGEKPRAQTPGAKPTPASEPSETVRLAGADLGLDVGEFALRDAGVVDGDTLKVEGIKRSLRLLAIDTEEVFHGKDNDNQKRLRKLMAEDYEAYVAEVAGDQLLPAKYATPLGDEATAWAAEFFAQAKALRLELDTPAALTGSYGRLLVYVWAIYTDGREPALYNLEAVRAGMSPYFVKYGRSQRFDAVFREAQDQARVAKRGIWDPDKQHYPDYERRLAWWSRRAAALSQVISLRAREVDFVEVGPYEAIESLRPRVDKSAEVTVFGIVDDHSAFNLKAFGQAKAGAERVVLRLGSPNPIEVRFSGVEVVNALLRKPVAGEAVFARGRLTRTGSPLPKGRGKFMALEVTKAEHLQLADQPFQLGD